MSNPAPIIAVQAIVEVIAAGLIGVIVALPLYPISQHGHTTV